MKLLVLLVSMALSASALSISELREKYYLSGNACSGVSDDKNADYQNFLKCHFPNYQPDSRHADR